MVDFRLFLASARAYICTKPAPISIYISQHYQDIMGEYIITIEFKADKETARKLNELIGMALDDIYSEYFDGATDDAYQICDAILSADQKLVKRIN